VVLNTGRFVRELSRTGRRDSAKCALPLRTVPLYTIDKHVRLSWHFLRGLMFNPRHGAFICVVSVTVTQWLLHGHVAGGRLVYSCVSFSYVKLLYFYNTAWLLLLVGYYLTSTMRLQQSDVNSRICCELAALRVRSYVGFEVLCFVKGPLLCSLSFVVLKGLWWVRGLTFEVQCWARVLLLGSRFFLGLNVLCWVWGPLVGSV